MADVAIVKRFAPFGSGQGLAALGARNGWTESIKSARIPGSELHVAFLVVAISPRPPSLPDANDRIVTVHSPDMKQRR